MGLSQWAMCDVHLTIHLYCFGPLAISNAMTSSLYLQDRGPKRGSRAGMGEDQV